MFKTLEYDRKNIENKYHLVSEEYDAFNRFAYHGYEYDSSTGLNDMEMDKKLRKLSEEMINVSHPVFKAKLFECVLDNTMIDVNQQDYFVGIYSWGRLIQKYTSEKWAKEVSDELPESNEVFEQLDTIGCGFGWLDFDHTIPNWDFLLENGFSGVLERIQRIHAELVDSAKITRKQEDFYEAVVIEYKAIIRLLDRIYKYALTKDFDKAPDIAECIRTLRDGAPENTYEALQLIYLYFMLSESVDNYQVRSLGYGLDSSLYPFFERDIATGRYSKDEISEFIGYFLMQWAAIDYYWGHPMYLGGVKKDGTTKINELSYLILDIYNELGIYNPKIQIIYDKSMPKDFLMKALDMIRNNVSSIVFVNQEIATKSLMSVGATYDMAIDTVISGCYEYNVKDWEIGIGVFHVNIPKAVTFVIDNGYDEENKRQVGLKTGKPVLLKTFDDFYNAFLKQLEFLVLRYFKALDLQQERVAQINPSIMYSALSDRCSEKLTDALDSGLRNSTAALMCGLASAVDALMSIYELVYEKKVATLEEMKRALDCNWQGHEKLRCMAKNAKHKYGNNDAMADSYADAITRYFTKICGGLKNSHGGSVNVEMHSARAFVVNGEKAKATADGRCKGDEFSKNASPVPGADKNGITALINSATKMDSALTSIGFCLDAMLHPSSVQGEGGIKVLHSVLTTYMEKGGASIHFNIFDEDMLKDAQKHPEKYENLQVRVCGWNTKWNNMNKKEQDAYILRAKNII